MLTPLPYISRAARDLNRADRSTCIITLNHGEGGSMTPLPHILGAARNFNRTWPFALVADKLRQGVKDETATPPGWENIPTGDEMFEGALTAEELERKYDE